MKKFRYLFLGLVLASLFSCNNDVDIHQEKQRLTHKSIRSYSEAQAIANSSISMIEEDSVSTRGEKCRRCLDLGKTKVISNSQTRSEGSLDTLLYVFNFQDDQGFAVVSAKYNAGGLIAVTESGNYDACLEENEAFAEYMANAINYVASSTDSTSSRVREPFVIESDTAVSRVGPYVRVKWNQAYPEGVFYPNGIAGCGNVAVLQIMSYYQYPTQIELTYPNADSTIINLEWARMKSHVTSGASNDYCTADYHQAHSDIAHLCRQIGEYAQFSPFPDDINLNYTLDTYVYPYGHSTSTNISRSRQAFQMFGYSTTDIQYYSSQCTKSLLNNHQLVFMRGTATEGGHAWVVDGYKSYLITMLTNATLTPSLSTRREFYNHINWGWSGHCNGYFLDRVFSPSNAESFDNNIDNSSNHSFNSELRYFAVSH